MKSTTFTIESAPQDATAIDELMMSRALELASKGSGQVSPGPLVGCVIAGRGGEILGEGFYVYEKLKHAETYAIEQAGARAKGSTAYVSLEPHAHQGRTPPCTDALINAGVIRVVAPIEDPNPKVSGQGFAHLRRAGIEVTTDVLAHEAEQLNEKYLHFMRTGLPFVHLKLAASLDGKIATRSGDSRWITGLESRKRVHELRHEYDAILVGAGTACTDDPLLTDRSGQTRRRPLVRIVLDERLSMSETSQLVTTASDSPVLVFAGQDADKSKLDAFRSHGVEAVQTADGGRNFPGVLEELGRRSIQSVLIEGGASVAGRLLDAGLVNKVSFFIAPLIIGGEAPSAIGGEGAARLQDAFRLRDVSIVSRGDDLEITGYPQRGTE